LPLAQVLTAESGLNARNGEVGVVKKLKQALVNPASVFAKPNEVVFAPALSRKQKIDVLRRWEYDARMLQMENQESKVDESEELLAEILESLQQLDYWPDLDRRRR
jgi:hypothetical protein